VFRAFLHDIFGIFSIFELACFFAEIPHVEPDCSMLRQIWVLLYWACTCSALLFRNNKQLSPIVSTRGHVRATRTCGQRVRIVVIPSSVPCNHVYVLCASGFVSHNIISWEVWRKAKH
jgi:hypothetical protein